MLGTGWLEVKGSRSANGWVFRVLLLAECKHAGRILGQFRGHRCSRRSALDAGGSVGTVISPPFGVEVGLLDVGIFRGCSKALRPRASAWLVETQCSSTRSSSPLA